MIFELAQDFHEAVASMPMEHPKRRMLELLEEAIRRDIHFIGRHPTTLFQCMWNTCWWYDCPEAAKHYEEPEGGWKEPPPWAPPTVAFYKLLEAWRTTRQQVFPGFLWLRSLRPPATLLNTGIKGEFFGHQSGLNSVAFSPDCRRIASAGDDLTIRVWDVESGRQLNCLTGHANSITGVRYLPDGRRIVSGAHDGTVRLWDSESGAQLYCLHDQTQMVRAVAVSPDGRRIAGACDNSLRIWDVETRQLMLCIPTPWDFVLDVEYSPDGKKIASAECSGANSEDMSGSVNIWDVKTGGRLCSSRVYPGWMNCVAFSPDGRHVAGACDDHNIWILNAVTGEELCCSRGHRDGVAGVAYSPDKQRIISTSRDGTLRLWDSNCGAEVCLLGRTEGWGSSVAYSADGRKILLGTGDPVGKGKNTVYMFDAEESGHMFSPCDHENWINATAFSSNGSCVASAGNDHAVLVWDVKKGTQSLCFKGHTEEVTGVAWAPNGRQVASSSRDKTVILWDSKDGSVSQRLEHWYSVQCAAFSPDGRRLLTGTDGGAVHVWDIARGRLSSSSQFRNWITCVAFCPDGRHIVCGSYRKLWLVLEVYAGIQPMCIPGHDGLTDGIAVSRDGQQIVSTGGTGRKTVRVWDITHGKCVKELEGRADVSAVAAGHQSCPLLVRGMAVETVIEKAERREQIAWFPVSLSALSTHFSDKLWAGSVANHLYLIVLEGMYRP